MNFENIILQDMSWAILQFLFDKEPMKAADIAEAMELNTRQINGAITKSLVRHGFVIREAKLTRVLKKDYNLIRITDKGKAFVTWKQTQE